LSILKSYDKLLIREDIILKVRVILTCFS